MRRSEAVKSVPVAGRRNGVAERHGDDLRDDVEDGQQQRLLLRSSAGRVGPSCRDGGHMPSSARVPQIAKMAFAGASQRAILLSLMACLCASFYPMWVHFKECSSNPIDAESPGFPPPNPSRPVAVAPLLYSRDSNIFSQTFTSCIRDPSCRILYNHIQKTGGSLLASKFYPILDENDEGEQTGKKYDSKEWCCGQRLWEKFQNKTESYCSLKFGVYETDTRMFGDVVKSCRRHRNKRKREVVLFTVRDPVQRTLSLINMICNKSFNTRPKEDKNICRRCNYDGGEGGSDSKFYDSFANDTLGMYMGLEPTVLATVKLFEEMRLEEENNGHQSHVLILDNNSDINSFVQDIEQQRNSTLPKGRSNVGKTNRCDFQMPPTMRKNMQPAMDIYQKIVNESFDPGVLSV